MLIDDDANHEFKSLEPKAISRTLVGQLRRYQGINHDSGDEDNEGSVMGTPVVNAHELEAGSKSRW